MRPGNEEVDDQQAEDENKLINEVRTADVCYSVPVQV